MGFDGTVAEIKFVVVLVCGVLFFFVFVFAVCWFFLFVFLLACKRVWTSGIFNLL